VDWHSITSWRPNISDLIIATLLAGLAERWWHWLYRFWNFLLDRIASFSNKLKVKRVANLELKIKTLKEYDDRKILVVFLRLISNLIILTGFVIVVSIFVAQNSILMDTLLISDFLKIPDPSFLELTQGAPGLSTFTVTELLYVAYVIILGLIILYSLLFVSGLFQMMDDFFDPPKAILRLEEQINALRAERDDAPAA
jgi:hypothetical protein